MLSISVFSHYLIVMNSKAIRSQETKISFSSEDFLKALEQHSYEFQKGQVVRGKVHEYASDGAYVDIGGKSSAFLPMQEVSLSPVTSLSEMLPLNEERDFLIIRDQNEDGQVTVSIRLLEVKKAWNKLAEIQESGQSIQVRVTGMNKGGVTVDVQGLRGFIPRSHLLEKDNLQNLIGQAITVSFIEVNRENKKIVLSQRLATRSVAISQLETGKLVTGEIVSLKPFGAFVDINGITGLLHISQISKNRIESLENVFQIGQEIKALIINVDEGKGRISLSTKVLENYPGEILEKMEEVMASAQERANRASNSVSQ